MRHYGGHHQGKKLATHELEGFLGSDTKQDGRQTTIEANLLREGNERRSEITLSTLSRWQRTKPSPVMIFFKAAEGPKEPREDWTRVLILSMGYTHVAPKEEEMAPKANDWSKERS